MEKKLFFLFAIFNLWLYGCFFSLSAFARFSIALFLLFLLKFNINISRTDSMDNIKFCAVLNTFFFLLFFPVKWIDSLDTMYGNLWHFFLLLLLIVWLRLPSFTVMWDTQKVFRVNMDSLSIYLFVNIEKYRNPTCCRIQ